MNSLSERLKFLMKQAGLKQYELARGIGVKQQDISRICTGRTERTRLILPIATELGANPHWLLSGEGDIYLEGDLKTISVYKLPVIDWRMALNWPSQQDSFDHDSIGEWWDIASHTVSDKGFALRLSGDSMEGLGSRCIPDGAVLIVETASNFQHGDLVIAKLPGAFEATVKQIVLDGNRNYLKSFNPAYPILSFDDRCEVIGIVKQAILEY